MPQTPPAIRRLVIAVDLVRYSTRDHLRQIDLQQRLVDVLDEACQRADIPVADCLQQAQGDGKLLLLPPGLDEASVVPDFVKELPLALRQVNRDLADHARLRLRVGLHQGIVHETANGFVSTAVVRACRMRDSNVARAAMDTLPACEMALAVSENLFEDILEHGYRGVSPSTFTRFLAAEKEFESFVWMHMAFDPQRLAEQRAKEIRPVQDGGLADAATIPLPGNASAQVQRLYPPRPGG